MYMYNCFQLSFRLLVLSTTTTYTLVQQCLASYRCLCFQLASFLLLNVNCGGLVCQRPIRLAAGLIGRTDGRTDGQTDRRSNVRALSILQQQYIQLAANKRRRRLSQSVSQLSFSLSRSLARSFSIFFPSFLLRLDNSYYSILYVRTSTTNCSYVRTRERRNREREREEEE